MATTSLSLQTLKEAVQIQEQIEALQTRLSQIMGGTAAASAKKAKPTGRRKMSAAARARIGAATKARWAELKGKSASKPAKTPAKKSRKKNGLTPEGRARLAASMKARWAERKKAAAKASAA